MRGFIYNNPKLAHEDDGYWTFNEGKPEPHPYWCVLKEMPDDMVFMAPVWFDLMDNLPNSVIESCPMQMSDGILDITIGIGRCVYREKSDLTTEAVLLLNPEKAKEACRYLARMLRGE